jgi:hypothetical protein
MKILILTPDGVGSTLLQRILAMGMHLENIDVVNHHELTNGIKLEANVIRKDWSLKYSQTLKQIQELLEKSDNTVSTISRLAKYHLDIRQDSQSEQKQFYEYLKKNYNKIISCRRKNIFEYAMSWSIRNESGILNIYSRIDKQKVLQVKKVNELFFDKKCQEYVDYVRWADEHFPDSMDIYYEDMVIAADKTFEKILGTKDTFLKKFKAPLSEILKTEYEFLNDEQPTQGPLYKKLFEYKMLSRELIDKGIILNQPIKNTTLSDKRKNIANFDQCLERFRQFAKNHNWIDQDTATYDFWNRDRLPC